VDGTSLEAIYFAGNTSIVFIPAIPDTVNTFDLTGCTSLNSVPTMSSLNTDFGTFLFDGCTSLDIVAIRHICDELDVGGTTDGYLSLLGMGVSLVDTPLSLSIVNLNDPIRNWFCDTDPLS
jgi:hypothetical protein